MAGVGGNQALTLTWRSLFYEREKPAFFVCGAGGVASEDDLCPSARQAEDGICVGGIWRVTELCTGQTTWRMWNSYTEGAVHCLRSTRLPPCAVG